MLRKNKEIFEASFMQGQLKLRHFFISFYQQPAKLAKGVLFLKSQVSNRVQIGGNIC